MAPSSDSSGTLRAQRPCTSEPSFAFEATTNSCKAPVSALVQATRSSTSPSRPPAATSPSTSWLPCVSSRPSLPPPSLIDAEPQLPGALLRRRCRNRPSRQGQLCVSSRTLIRLRHLLMLRSQKRRLHQRRPEYVRRHARRAIFLMRPSFLAPAGSKPVKSGENSYESAIWTFNPQTKQFTGAYTQLFAIHNSS